MEKLPNIFNLIPLNGKVPLVGWREYIDRYSTSEERVEWDTKYPGHRTGIITGPISGLFVLDVDGELGENSLKGYHIPKTISVKTPKGRHFYFKWTSDLDSKTTTKTGILPGVDVRGAGGLVAFYGFEYGPHLRSLFAAPQWLINLLPDRNAVKVIEDTFKKLDYEKSLQTLKDSPRHNTLFQIAGGLRSRGYNPDEIYELLAPKGREVGLLDKDVRYIADRMERYPMGQRPPIEEVSIPENFEQFLTSALKVEYLVPGIFPKRGIAFVAGLPETAKCFAAGTLVLMFDGSTKRIEEVLVGDQLMGDDSHPRMVSNIGHGIDEMFKINPRKGDTYTVNKSHILCLKQSGSLYGRKHGEALDVSLEEYSRLPQNEKVRLKGYRVGADFSEKKVPVDPYILGVWLGDGTCREPEITQKDRTGAVVLALKTFAAQNNLKIREYKHPKRVSMWRISGQKGAFRRSLRELNVLNNKHIPIIYRSNSRAIRLELLAGLIDTDGCLDHNCYAITTVYPQLRDDILFLARSLGFAAYSHIRQVHGKDYFGIIISGNICKIPVRINYKKAALRKKITNVLVHGLTVESQGIGTYYGITITGPNHRFLLADFTVVHNTWILIDLAIEIARKESGIWMGHYPVVHGKVLFLDQERPKEETQRRFKALTLAKNIHPKDLIDSLTVRCGTTFRLNLEASLKSFRHLLEEERPEVVVIDSYKTIHTLSINDHLGMQEVLEKVKALRNEFNCSFIFVYHENKGSFERLDSSGKKKEITFEYMAGALVMSEVAESILITSKADSSSSWVHHVKNSYGQKQSPVLVTVEDVTPNKEQIKVVAR